LSGYSTGAILSNANGGLTSGTIALNNSSFVSNTLGVGNGGTGTNSTFTQGSVVFAGASGVYNQDNGSLFYNSGAHQLALGTTVTNSSLTVVGIASQPIASFSAIAANSAGVIIDNSTGNIFSASNSGATRFVITGSGIASVSASFGAIVLNPSSETISTTMNKPLTLSGGGAIGGIALSGYTNNNNSVLYANSTGTLQVAETSGSGTCLMSNGAGAAPSWQSCPSGPGGSSSNWWTLDTANGILFPGNLTTDLLVGGNSTKSASFHFYGNASPQTNTNPAASVSANTSAAGFVVDNKGTGNIFTASSSGQDRFVITQAGVVGIGIDNPTTATLLKAQESAFVPTSDLVQINNVAGQEATADGVNG